MALMLVIEAALLLSVGTSDLSLPLVVDGRGETLALEDEWPMGFVTSRGLRDKGGLCADDFCVASLLMELKGKSAEKGCPSEATGSGIRLFVAVPSAAKNVDRRNAIRETWCRRSERAVVKFFVGGDVEDDEGDVIILDLEDAASTVVEKMFRAMAFVEGFSHFVRVEDDVFLFPDRLAASLSGDEVVVGNFATWAGIPYPRGHCVVLTAKTAKALAFNHKELGLPSSRDRPPPKDIGHAKGIWIREMFWPDDAFLGVVLYPWNLTYVEEPRFHDLPGRGPNAGRVSLTSIAVNAVQSRSEFLAIAKNAPGVGVQRTWRLVDNYIEVRADIDHRNVLFTLDAVDPSKCKDDARNAAATSEDDTSLVHNIYTALLAVCDEKHHHHHHHPDDAASSWSYGLRTTRPNDTRPLLELYSTTTR